MASTNCLADLELLLHYSKCCGESPGCVAVSASRGRSSASRGSTCAKQPGLTAKRIIDCVGRRLREVDPQRWGSVPITFNTHFRDEGGALDTRTCANIHDALEREFGIEIKDRYILIGDVQAAFYVINEHHDAI